MDPFELCLLGGSVEKRYRRIRPDVERLPWDALDPAEHPAPLVEAARRLWTVAAFQEHKTAASCAATLEAMVAARAPVDLIAVASRFVLDEMVHVELCARVASRLGGAVRLDHDPRALCPPPAAGLSPLGACAELMVRVFCVGESFSVPMQRAAARAERHPLLAQVVRRIARDEAAHGELGWIFLDWAADSLDAPTRDHLRAVARRAIAAVENTIPSPSAPDGPTLGWLPSSAYAAHARRALDDEVIAPLRARDLY